MQLYEFYFKTIRGTQLPMDRFRGRAVLLFNSATESQYARQLSKLQRLWENYRNFGLAVIALPCNDFGEREPGDETEIARRCEEEFGVHFPLTTKQSLRGRFLCPAFRALKEAHGRDIMPRGNFFKYLFDTQGQLRCVWPNRIEPNDPVIKTRIEKELKAWIL